MVHKQSLTHPLYYNIVLLPALTQVDETTYRTTIENVNQCFDEAEALGCCNVLEGCLACMTGFALHYCFKTHYERVSVAAAVCVCVCVCVC